MEIDPAVVAMLTVVNPDLTVYIVHSAFWSAFGLTLLILRARKRLGTATSEPTAAPPQERTARFSRAVIASGAVLMNWAMVHFRSWRFRATLAEGHELATGGPFRFVRHPIYMGFNLLALGNAIMVPTPLVWAGFVLMGLGSDLRARVEERLLVQAFGHTYSNYMERTRRFIPGIY